MTHFIPDEWAQHSPTQMRTYLFHNLPNPHGPEPVPSGPYPQQDLQVLQQQQ